VRTGAAHQRVGNFHEAGFFASDAEFLDLLVPFVTEGAAAGEPVLIGYDARKSELLRATLPDSDAATFITDAGLYASPAGAIEAYRRQFDWHVAAGAGQIRITGEIAQAASGGRFAGWDRYESAVNAVWQDYPVWSRCLYDATIVPDVVRDVVERTHPRLLIPGGGALVSPRYQDIVEFEPLPPSADPVETTRPALALTDATPREVRHSLAVIADGRVPVETAEELILSVSEAVENALLHGRPPITVTAWTSRDRMVVHVHDAGPGPANPLAGLVPDVSSVGGRGLWLSHQLAGVEIALLYRADGFTVRLRSVGRT
jgi:hypothetical protein